ncbi:protein phosphatase 1 regulatory subunit 1B [Chanos chanos]|uniref:Protein phosphatase 1 regulatory subunit 1B n=1 Tax=Chanos chanos TaxID=29144 RepID=A0A6J2X020_CHACN|nr:protein phosphatase 1 regulatory subunit 1B-like [Chanos chanos]
MEPSGTPDVPAEPKERRKIQFAVPASAPTQLDPRQVEMIRRRRPTPATLFRVADQSSPEDDNSTHQWVVGENGVLKPKRVNPNVYQPPSLRAVQQMAEAQMQKLGVYPHMEEENEDTFQGDEEENAPVYTADQQEEMGTTDSQSETSLAGALPQAEKEGEKEKKTEEESRNSE